MKTVKSKTVWNNSRNVDKQQGKGERRTDVTPKPETGRKQREQQSGERAKPQNCLPKSEQVQACLGFIF
jgi:hypothetical protein